MAIYDAVAVFGARLQEDNSFPSFVYKEIDRAMQLVESGQAPRLIFCGNYWAGEKFRGVRECDVAEKYIRVRYPHILSRFYKEGRSTTVPENWLFMKLDFPSVRKIHQVTIEPFLPRMKFCGDWIYGDDGELTHEALPWPNTFPHEPLLLKIMQCMFTVQNNKKRGDHTFLLQKGSSNKSQWVKLWDAHGGCRRCFT